MASSKKTVGINKAIEADATGAVAAFHRIEYYAVDLRAKYSTLTINGYVSAAAYANNKQALTSMSVSVPGLPADTESTLDFFYRTVTQPAAESAIDPVSGMPMPAMQTNIFAGAELVSE